MKILELLESYFEGLYHISSKADLTLENLEIRKSVGNEEFQNFIGKPMYGLYLAKGLSWHNWASKEKFRETGKDYLYRIKLKPTAKILQIEAGRKVPEEFLLQPVKIKDYKPPKINYKEIAKKYDGVAASKLSFGTFWDVPSVVVFNKNIIQSIENLGIVAKAIEKTRKLK